MPLPDFAEILSGLMAERDMSLRALAREIPIDPGQLSRVLNRIRPPSPGVAARCDEIFGSGTRLAGAAEQVRAAATASARLPDCPVSLSATPLEAALERREVSADTIRAFEDMVTLLRRLDDEVGPGQLVDTVSAHLTTVTVLLSQADPSSAGFVGLGRVAAGLSQLMGWLSFDLNQPDRARVHLAAAHRAAIACGDTLLAAYSMSWQGLIVGQVDPRSGLALALTADRRAGPDAPASVLAWLARVEAESAAGQGNRYETERALDRLTTFAARPRTERDPAWTYFIDDGQIAAYRGVCYVRLERGQDAEAALRQALDALPASFVRDRCLYLTYLSAAHLLQQQPQDAAVVAAQALGLAIRTQSPRSIDRLAGIHRELAPWQRLPEVEELGDLLTAHRYG